jgi:hypothetical protein
VKKTATKTCIFWCRWYYIKDCQRKAICKHTSYPCHWRYSMKPLDLLTCKKLNEYHSLHLSWTSASIFLNTYILWSMTKIPYTGSSIQLIKFVCSNDKEKTLMELSKTVAIICLNTNCDNYFRYVMYECKYVMVILAFL